MDEAKENPKEAAQPAEKKAAVKSAPETPKKKMPIHKQEAAKPQTNLTGQIHVRITNPVQQRKEILKLIILTIELLKRTQALKEIYKLKKKAMNQMRDNLQDLKRLSLQLDLAKFPELPPQIAVPVRKEKGKKEEAPRPKEHLFIKRRTELDRLDEEIEKLKEKIMHM